MVNLLIAFPEFFSHRFINLFLSMFFSEAEHVQKYHRPYTKPHFSDCVLFHNIFLLQDPATDERASLNPILWRECMRAQSCLTLATPWTAACQALSVEFSRQEYCSRLPFPSPGGLPNPGFKPCISPVFPALPGVFFTTEPPGSPTLWKKKEIYC